MADRLPIPDLPDLMAAEPFTSNAAAFAAGLNLLRNLREMRPGLYASVRNDAADALVTAYCKRLRASGRSITLAAVQRHAHLLDEVVVIVLVALRFHFMGCGESDIRSAISLAVGLDPVRQKRLVRTLQRNGAVFWDESFRMWPNRGIVNYLCGEAIDDREAIWLKSQIKALPSTESNRRPSSHDQNPEPV